MNITSLQAVTEDLASYLSEVTDGDLSASTPCACWTVGDLYQHLVDENNAFGQAIGGRSIPPTATTEYRDSQEFQLTRVYGGGFEEIYRHSARYMEEAFAAIDDPGECREVAGIPGMRSVAELLEMQIADTVIHTWDLARAIGFDYTPQPDIADLVLRRMQAVPAVARGEGKPFGAALEEPQPEAHMTTLDRLLLLSGRDFAWQPSPRPSKVRI